MTSSRWPSVTFRRLSSRERAVVLGGAALSVAAIAWALGVAPAVVRWQAREAAIAVRAEHLGRLRALVARDTLVRREVATLQARATRARGQMLDGATPALAASALQVLLGQYAERSGVSLERVDVAGLPIPADSLLHVPVRVMARGTLGGLVDLLFYIQHGEPLLVIDDLRVLDHQTRGAGEGDLAWTIALHGFHLAAPEAVP